MTPTEKEFYTQAAKEETERRNAANDKRIKIIRVILKAFTACLILFLAGTLLVFFFIPEERVSRKEDCTVRTWINRSNGHYVSESISFDNGDFISGPLSETGKWNGKWELVSMKAGTVIAKWYWYGKEVDEGEWHRLANR